MTRTTDALVLGAGAAGLAAAREISRAGLTVRIVEARDRIGGRILTLRPPGAPLPVELGAEFVHGEPDERFHAGGPRAEKLLDLPAEARLDRSLDSLARILSVPRRSLDEALEAAHVHDWRSDPFSRGAYSYVGVGGLAAQRALARPVEGTLFFAGDALDPDETGTVAGALATGRRAGAALVRALGR